ncbi:kinase-like protein [Schizopora paradoxa]|uniref:Kinase-like protein n=1 Tax=Schizopora paradoxa TaxID=27342 RepID=A0A0H2R371_9AGAM|nr:kinase-like protein [Schizopora paradoxa]
MEYMYGGKYRVEEEIGFGGCGSVYMATHAIAGKEVAVKVEPADMKHSMLKQESRIYKSLMGGPGVPWVMWSGRQGDYNVMVMDLLGPSLEDLFHICNKQFSLKTVLLLADQMISLVEYIHSRDWVHRDIKPANFLMGSDLGTSCQPSSCDRVNIIDFGLSKKYHNASAGEHVKNAIYEGVGVGTPLFASINTHQGQECSRRDDMESLAYTFIYLLRGSLPWRKVKYSPSERDAAERDPKLLWDKTLISKLAAESADPSSPSSLTIGLPKEFELFYRYVRDLAFDETPDYQWCRDIFRGLAKRKRIAYDGEFDWSMAGERIWRRRATSTGGKGTSASTTSTAPPLVRQRSRYCEACEARAAAEAAAQSTPASLSRRSR